MRGPWPKRYGYHLSIIISVLWTLEQLIFLLLGPTALIYLKNGAVKRIYVALEILKLNE